MELSTSHITSISLPLCSSHTSCWLQVLGREGRLCSTHTSFHTSSSVGSLGMRSKYGSCASSAWPGKKNRQKMLCICRTKQKCMTPAEHQHSYTSTYLTMYTKEVQYIYRRWWHGTIIRITLQKGQLAERNNLIIKYRGGYLGIVPCLLLVCFLNY